MTLKKATEGCGAKPDIENNTDEESDEERTDKYKGSDDKYKGYCAFFQVMKKELISTMGQQQVINLVIVASWKS